MLHYVLQLCDVDSRLQGAGLRPPKLAASSGVSNAARIGADVCAFHPKVEDFKGLG